MNRIRTKKLLFALILPILLIGWNGCARSQRDTLLPGDFGRNFFRCSLFSKQRNERSHRCTSPGCTGNHAYSGTWSADSFPISPEFSVYEGPFGTGDVWEQGAESYFPPTMEPNWEQSGDVPEEDARDLEAPPQGLRKSRVPKKQLNNPIRQVSELRATGEFSEGEGQDPFPQSGEIRFAPPSREISDSQRIVSGSTEREFPYSNGRIVFENAPYFSPEGVSFHAIGSTASSDASSPEKPISKPKWNNPLGDFTKAVKREYQPLTDRDWIANHARQATAEIVGDTVFLSNVRNTNYRSGEDYTTTYSNATYKLSEVDRLYLLEIPFKNAPSLAHVEVSFGFTDGRYLGISVEARYEKGEFYDPVAGMGNQFELIYVVAEERDMVRINTDINGNDVHLYQLNLTPEEVRTVFVDMLQRANGLSTTPEFYHTVKNNCTTNIIEHINRAKPDAIPYEYRALFSGYLDHLLYDLGMIATEAKSFKEARDNSKINRYAIEFGDTEFFSAGIRQHLY